MLIMCSPFPYSIAQRSRRPILKLDLGRTVIIGYWRVQCQGRGRPDRGRFWKRKPSPRAGLDGNLLFRVRVHCRGSSALQNSSQKLGDQAAELAWPPKQKQSTAKQTRGTRDGDSFNKRNISLPLGSAAGIHALLARKSQEVGGKAFSNRERHPLTQNNPCTRNPKNPRSKASADAA